MESGCRAAICLIYSNQGEKDAHTLVKVHFTDQTQSTDREKGRAAATEGDEKPPKGETAETPKQIKQTEEKKTASEINEQQDKGQNFHTGYHSLFLLFHSPEGKVQFLYTSALDGHGLRIQRHTCACIFA